MAKLIDGVRKLAKSIGDLHTRKNSHLATPIDSQVEWHIRNEEINIPTKVGKSYATVTPVICTSRDNDSGRYRQTAKTFVSPLNVFKDLPLAPNDQDAKNPMSGKLNSVASKIRNKEV